MKPKAGIFVDEFSATDHTEVSNGSLKMHYTMVADELALYNMSLNESFFSVSMIQVDTQKRWVEVRRGGNMHKTWVDGQRASLGKGGVHRECENFQNLIVLHCASTSRILVATIEGYFAMVIA